ncbi:hypothetical protein BDP81DRAFT_491264, partial [Colletotrichum phormii]
VEDYLTKTTAVFPPREYLCLSSRIDPQLSFKGQPVSPRFNAANLTGSERKRLLRAFLRYYLTSLMNCDIQQLCKQALHRYSGRNFQQWDLPAVLCVCTYLDTLYVAMFAQCGDSWLPEVTLGSPSSQSPGLLYPDSLCVDCGAYTYDFGCSPSLISGLEPYGFDLVTILLRTARAGQLGRDRLKQWFDDIRPGHGSRRGGVLYQSLDLGSFGAVKEGFQDGPGMYQILHSRITLKLLTTYEQRAWVFFDDARFYPSASLIGKPHLPTEIEAKDERFETIQKHEAYRYHAWGARVRHRSQKWHNKKSRGKTRIEDYQDSKLEKDCQVPLPDIVYATQFTTLRPFWEWD